MIAGREDYHLRLSRLAYCYRGGAPLDYLENQPTSKIERLEKDAKQIAEEVSSGQ